MKYALTTIGCAAVLGLAVVVQLGAAIGAAVGRGNCPGGHRLGRSRTGCQPTSYGPWPSGPRSTAHHLRRPDTDD